VPLCDVAAETAIVRLDSDPVTPGGVVSVCMSWWCGIGEEDDNEKKWEVLRNI
jgi:hypothetical protein